MSSQGERALRHAVRVGVVLRYAGELGLVLGVSALVPMLGAVVFGELALVAPYAAIAAGLVALGLLARRTPAPRDLQRSEALVVTVVVFAASPVVMSVPLVLQGIPWLDALFEAVSGVTTTGLSTLASVEGRPRTFLLARAWTQWVGGLGFVALSLALVMGPGISARRLAASGLDPTDPAASMRAYARRVLGVYLALTALGVGALLVLGAGPFDALLHTFAGLSTGGFAPRDASLAALGARLQWGVMGISLLGAVSLPLYHELRLGRWRRLRDDAEARALLLMVALVTALLFAAVRGAGGVAGVDASDVALLAISSQSTAGFATFDLAALPDAAKALLVGSMLIGGSAGSTAGGLKLLRVLLMVRLVQWLVGQTRLPPHALTTPRLEGQPIDPPELLRAAAVVGLFGAVAGASWLPFLAYGYAPLEALFEVASATGTVGLSVGISRPELEPLLKGVLCLDMLLGRLEVFAVLVALAPRTWIGRRTPTGPDARRRGP